MSDQGCSTFLIVSLLTGILGCCLAHDAEYIIWCANTQWNITMPPGYVMIFVDARYGNNPRESACGARRPAGHNCGRVIIDDALNYYCFGKNMCLLEVSDRAFGTRCNASDNYLQFKLPFGVPELNAQILCDGSAVNAEWGYIFAYGHSGRDCRMAFTMGESDHLELRLFNYYLVDTWLIRCGHNLYITTSDAQEMTAELCTTHHSLDPNRNHDTSLDGPVTLIVTQQALDTGFGFLLHYLVKLGTTSTQIPVLPPPESTEPTIIETVSTGPLDNNGTTVTLPQPGITRFVRREDIQPADISEKDHRVIIVVVCMIILVAIITATVVVFFVVKRLRKNVKHNDEVQHAVQSLAYRPSLERNRYGDLPTVTQDVIRQADPTTPVPTYTSTGSSSPIPIQSSSPTQRETSPPTTRPAPRPILFMVNKLYSGNEELSETDTPIHGPPAETDPSLAHGPPLVPPRANTEQLTTPQASLYVNEKFEHGPTVDRSTRPDRRSVVIPPGSLVPVQVPDTPPPPYVQVDPNEPNLDAEVTNIIAALALSNGAYSPYLNI